MPVQGMPGGGYKTVGQIVPTNNLRFRSSQSAMGIAVELLTAHSPGGPVVDGAGQCVGFISEFDVLKAVNAGKDLNKIIAKDLMNKTPLAVHESTTIADAIRLMEMNHYLVLPIERDGKVKYSVTRHDLLRATIGLGLDIENQ